MLLTGLPIGEAIGGHQYCGGSPAQKDQNAIIVLNCSMNKAKAIGAKLLRLKFESPVVQSNLSFGDISVLVTFQA